jgi:hypothetical protein
MKPVPTYELLLWERMLQQIPLHPWWSFSTGNGPGQKRNVLPGNQQPKYAFVALPLSYGLPFGPAGLEPATHELKK